MKTLLKWKWWLLWSCGTVLGGAYLAGIITTSEDKRAFLPGVTTHGHYQIELDCSACHTPYMGVKQDACMQCHEEELNEAHDSHPESKFTDPGNAHLLKHIRADRCVTCHQEHNPDVTRPMGVTLPDNYCSFCHQDIAEERPSHEGYAFSTCANTGCHNFHDNRGLYEAFLVKHLDEPDLLDSPKVPLRNDPKPHAKPIAVADYDAPRDRDYPEDLIRDWSETIHFKMGVNCKDCHAANAEKAWMDKPGLDSCRDCHLQEVETFGKGRHGMRLTAGLSPMTPARARQPMHEDALHRELSCVSCHGSHRFDVQFAAADACMQCHNDFHTNSFAGTPHQLLWEAEVQGTGTPGTGVSCATCHMPRTVAVRQGKEVVSVQHNQNDNLRPRDKMLRSVCLDCHGMDFSLQALANQSSVDQNFPKQNFPGPMKVDLPTMEWVKARVEEKKQSRNVAQSKKP